MSYAKINNIEPPEEIITHIFLTLGGTISVEYHSVKNCSFLENLRNTLNVLPNDDRVPIEIFDELRDTRINSTSNIGNMEFINVAPHDNNEKCVLNIRLTNVNHS